MCGSRGVSFRYFWLLCMGNLACYGWGIPDCRGSSGCVGLEPRGGGGDGGWECVFFAIRLCGFRCTFWINGTRNFGYAVLLGMCRVWRLGGVLGEVLGCEVISLLLGV